MTGKIRVLQLINSLNIGGAENFLLQLATSSSEQLSQDICVLWRERQTSPSLTLKNLQVQWKYDLTKVFRLIRLINTMPYDIVHVHLFPAQLFGALASYFTPHTIYVTTEHGSWNRRRRFGGFRLFDAFIFSRYSTVACVSEAVHYSLIQWLPFLEKKTLVIPNGIVTCDFQWTKPQRLRTRQSLGLESDNVVFSIVARLHPKKNHCVLLTAFKRVVLKIPKAKLLIVGDGTLRGNLEQLCHNLGLDDQSLFLGARQDIPCILAASDVFILPSDYEGLPIAVLEAMAAGLPVIGTTGPGFADVVVNGETGLLVPPRNEVALREAMLELAMNLKERARMGKAGRVRAVEMFDIHVIAKRYEELYLSLLENRESHH